MTKKVDSKKKIPAKKVTVGVKSKKNQSVEKVLVENFIALQKVMTNLAMKFDSLNTQISKLLELFEISAKTLAKKDITIGGDKDETQMGEKLNTLLDQNKIIARSLTLLHENPESMPQSMPTSQPMRQSMPTSQPMRQPMPIPQPMPSPELIEQPLPPPQLMRRPKPDQEPPKVLRPSSITNTASTKGYQRSMSSKNQESPDTKSAQ